MMSVVRVYGGRDRMRGEWGRLHHVVKLSLVPRAKLNLHAFCSHIHDNDRRSFIIVRFESYHERTQIWNRRRALKTIYVSEDFPIEISRKRNKMRPILKAASKQPQYKKCTTLKGDKLLFNGQLLTVDKLHNLPEPIHPRTLSEVRSGNVLLFGGMMSEYHELSNFYT